MSGKIRSWIRLQCIRIQCMRIQCMDTHTVYTKDHVYYTRFFSPINVAITHINENKTVKKIMLIKKIKTINSKTSNG